MLTELDPLVATWFAGRLGQPTEPQRLGWPEIRAGHDVLISAPTGSGKTLAAFLMAIDRLVRDARGGRLADETQVLYVSPLKALSNDVQKNLDAPLAEIAALAARQGVELPPIRTALRTGDTPTWERQQMSPSAAAHPGHHAGIAVYPADGGGSRARCCADRATIIVDEIHAWPTISAAPTWR